MEKFITIRDATTKDVELLADIIRQSFYDVAKRFSLTPENCPKHPSNCTAAWIKSDQKRGVRYFILSKNGIPIGCVGLENPDSEICYLERLSVIPEMRRKGYGRTLSHHALECAKETGARQLSIGIIADQTELKKWYADIGFVEVGKKKFEHLPFEVAIMKFELGR